MVDLHPVAESDKSVLANLVQLLCHDLSPYREYGMTEHGTFIYRYLDHYFVEPEREACFIRMDGQLVGFTMSRPREGDRREVSEFFVARNARRSGVGTAAATALFARHPGPWAVAFDDANGPACAFWPSVCARAAQGEVTSEHREPPASAYASTWLRFDTA